MEGLQTTRSISACSWVCLISSLFSCPPLTRYMRSHTTLTIPAPNSYGVNRFPALTQAHSSQSDTPANRGKRGTGASSVSKETERCIPLFQHILLLCDSLVILWFRNHAQPTFQHVWCNAEFCRIRPSITVWRLLHQSRQQWHEG